MKSKQNHSIHHPPRKRPNNPLKNNHNEPMKMKEAKRKPATNHTDQQRLRETLTVGLEQLTDHEAQK